MRALHLTRDFPPRSAGGVSTAVGGLVDALQAAGVRSAVASFDGWRPARHGAAPATPPVREDRGQVAVLRFTGPAPEAALRDFAAEQRPDLIHVHDPLLWEQAEGLDPASGRLLTVHVYQRELNRLRGVEQTMSQQAEDRALAGAVAISAPSAWVAEQLSRDHPELAGRIRVAGWGVGPELPAVTRPQPEDQVLYVGRFGDVKGTEELAGVMKRVLARRPTVRFVIAGGLPHNQRAERRWRDRLVADLTSPEGERVALMGWLSGDALEACYAQAGAAIVPSRFETFGLTALEAMARGLAVVATSAGGLPEMIEHDRTGLLSAPGDKAGLAAHLERVSADPTLATRLGDAARAQVEADHLWPERIGSWLELYGAC